MNLQIFVSFINSTLLPIRFYFTICKHRRDFAQPFVGTFRIIKTKNIFANRDTRCCLMNFIVTILCCEFCAVPFERLLSDHSYTQTITQMCFRRISHKRYENWIFSFAVFLAREGKSPTPVIFYFFYYRNIESEMAIPLPFQYSWQSIRRKRQNVKLVI